MEVIHYHVRIISRAKCKSAVASASYCSGEKLHNKLNGRYYNNTKKLEVVYKQILLPDNAPRSFFDRETLWNAVEQIEKSKNARTAREVEVSLPVELNLTEQINLIVNHVHKNFVTKGMCADVCIHDKGNGNPHAHILLTTRSLDENGNWMCKQHKNYTLDGNGKKIYDIKTKQYKCGKSIKINDWDNKENVANWRQEWARVCNLEFERKGLTKRVTHESYRLQGLDREPTIHIGSSVAALERRGIETDRGNKYHDIEARNHALKEKERLRQLERKKNRTRSQGYEISR